MINEPVATASTPVRQIRDEIMRRQRFLLTSHARPDGDSIGSELAMAFALEALGKQVRIVVTCKLRGLQRIGFCLSSVL